MTPLNLEIGLSSSSASGAQAGAGDFVIESRGGNTSAPTLSQALAEHAQASAAPTVTTQNNSWLLLAGAGIFLLAMVWLIFRKR